MSEKPVLFSGEMVRAILDGRKTQTRRVIKPQPTGEWRGWLIDTTGNSQNIGKACWDNKQLLETHMVRCPYGSPGDALWVRETWSASTDTGYIHKPMQGNRIWYRADNNRPTWAGDKWRPSIFMPRWASRITLQVTAVRVERVQDISYDDARAEGVNLAVWELHHQRDDSIHLGIAAREEFKQLWDSINAKRGYSWDTNPWVWVVEFERVTP